MGDINLTDDKGNWTRIIAIIFPYIIVVGFFQYLAYLILGYDFFVGIEVQTALQRFVILLFTSMGTFLIVWIFRRFVDKESFLSLGFKWLSSKHIIYGVLVGFVILTLGFMILFISNEIRYEGLAFIYSEFSFSFLTFSLVAVTEELLIRGYVLTNLMGSMNKYCALLISSAIFSLLHVANPNFSWFAGLELFLSGVLLGITYIYTRNLWFPIALHFSWNFFQGTIFGFNVSGINGYSIINQTRVENNLWNGGDFGFEGSLLSVVLQIICIIILYFIFKGKKPFRNNSLIETSKGLITNK